MVEGRGVLIVAVSDYSFSTVKEKGYYAFPASYGWKVPDYIAFYRKKPVSAITHVASVRRAEVGGKIDGEYRLMIFGDRVEEEAVLVEIDDLKKLNQHVEPDYKGGFQGAKYTTIEKLKGAEGLSEL